MGGAALGHRIAGAWKVFCGFCEPGRGGGTCPRSTPTVPPAGAVCGFGKRTEYGCGLGKRCWRGSISASCWTGKKPFWMRPSYWRKRGLRSRKDPSRERYEVHGGGRRPGHTYRSATRVRANLRVPARGKHAGASESATPRPRSSTAAVAAGHCRSRLRFRRAASAVVGSRHRVDRTLFAQQETTSF